MRRITSLALLLLALLAACSGDEGLSAYVAPNSTWQLSTLNSAPFPASASIAFPEPGRVTGHAPCNQFSAQQTAPYPWVEIKTIAATKMACDHGADEQSYFSALRAASIAEVSGNSLILSNEHGLEMVFKRQ
ncbi:MAG TPA: META domain-containing protein [Aliiroseovarius sp.]|nr:META domain-containing protein [Aliiroseovarius sp.]